MCDTLKKKCKRSFLDAWLQDDRYKFWIGKVSFGDSLFHCVVCNKKFSCNSYIQKHANSTFHKNNSKENNSKENVSIHISDGNLQEKKSGI